MLDQILPLVEERLSTSNRNLFILPVLDCEPMDKLIFPRVGYVVPEDSSTPEAPDSMIKTAIGSLLKEKRGNTIISLSILGVYANGSLTDELDYEWLEETDDIEAAMQEKKQLKVTKQRGEVKAYELNRQQISSWEEAKQILFHFHQLSEYLDYWRQVEETGGGAQTGVLYEIAEVEVDPEFGSIISTIKKCHVLRINQYLKESNFMMMRVSQSLHELVTKTKSVNTRDYPLIMFLSECFDPARECQLTLFTQLGTTESIKEEAVCMAINLQVPGRHIYLKVPSISIVELPRR